MRMSPVRMSPVKNFKCILSLIHHIYLSHEKSVSVVKLFFAKDEAELKKNTEVIVPATLSAKKQVGL